LAESVDEEGLMNKIMRAAAVCLFAAAVSFAQDLPKADIAVDYSHLEVLKGYNINMNGASGSADYNFYRWLAVAADFGVYHGYPSESLTSETFTAGPRFTCRHFSRFQPFAEGLFGGSHFNLNSGGVTGGGSEPALAVGAGLDILFGQKKRFGLRFQRDYFFVRSAGQFTVDDRLSAGVVFRIGKK
jgi:hypothetical protein